MFHSFESLKLKVILDAVFSHAILLGGVSRTTSAEGLDWARNLKHAIALKIHFYQVLCFVADPLESFLNSLLLCESYACAKQSNDEHLCILCRGKNTNFSMKLRQVIKCKTVFRPMEGSGTHVNH